jgi:hypothetical protein
MSAGFVKLRRGIVEHLPAQMTFEEYGIYTLIILNADHRTGVWRGCALALSKRVGKSERWCQYVLSSLRRKGYIKGKPSTGRGQYMISVEKYFEKVQGGAPFAVEGAPGVTLSSKKAHRGSPYQEVSTYKNKREEVNPRTGGAAPSPVEKEQRRRIEAKQKRQDKETEISKELYVGAGPVCVLPDFLWAEVKALAVKKALR